MSWFTQAASRWGKRPVWLFYFNKGGVVSRFTSRPLDYTDGDAVTWTQANLGHTRIRSTGHAERAAVKIVFPRTNAFAQQWRSDDSFEVNTVLIYHEYIGESPAARQIKYRGRVIGVEETILTITLVCEAEFTLLRGRGVSTTLQRPCRHAHYSSTRDGYGCGLNLADWQESINITSIDGLTLTGNGGQMASDNIYTHGIFEWNGKKQHITSHIGGAIRLLSPLDGIEDALASAGGSLSCTAAPGCTGSRAACDGFGNINKHGGCPWHTEFIGDGRTLF